MAPSRSETVVPERLQSVVPERRQSVVPERRQSVVSERLESVVSERLQSVVPKPLQSVLSEAPRIKVPKPLRSVVSESETKGAGERTGLVRDSFKATPDTNPDTILPVGSTSGAGAGGAGNLFQGIKKAVDSLRGGGDSADRPRQRQDAAPKGRPRRAKPLRSL